MFLKCRLRFVLAGILVVAAISLAYGKAPHPAEVRSRASSLRQHIYPLRFDPGTYAVWSFATMRDGESAVLAVQQDGLDMVFDEFLSGHEVHVSALDHAAYLRIGAVVDAPSTLNRVDFLDMPPPQKIITGDLTITLFPNNPEVFSPGMFGLSCPDPATSYIEVRRGSKVERKVLLYVFSKPVHPMARNRCDLFAPPHETVRVIDPILVARVGSDGNILLAGGSYVTMPDVISVPSGHMVAGNGTSLFVVDRSVIGDCDLLADDDYQSRVRAGTVSEQQGAESAALVEKCLLRAIGKLNSE